METKTIVTTTMINPNMLLFAIIILLIFLGLVTIISKYRIYKHAGKVGISSIIPIWSEITLFNIIDKPWWYIFLYLVPIVNFVIIIEANILLAKKFGKGAGIGLGMTFLPMIFIPLLSFYDYVDSEIKNEEPVFNPFNQTDVNQVMPTEPSSVVDNVVKTVEPVNIIESIPVAPVQAEETINNIGDSVVNETIVTPSNNLEGNTNDASLKEKGESANIEENVLSTPIINNPIIENENNDIITNVNAVIPQNDDIQITNPLDNIPNVIDNPIVENSVEIPVMDTSVNVANNDTNQNISMQDIESALNINKPLEATDIAFNSKPIGEEEANPIETLNADEVVSSNESIEMPEIAAKFCPACGTGLASDVKFCTSCGTQL